MVKIIVSEDDVIKIIADKFDVDEKNIKHVDDGDKQGFMININIEELKKKGEPVRYIPYPVSPVRESIEPYKRYKRTGDELFPPEPRYICFK